MLAWAVALLIVGLNLWLAWRLLPARGWAAAGLPLAGLLAVVAFAPLRQRRTTVLPEIDMAGNTPLRPYRSILVPLDHSGLDAVAIQHAAALARSHDAEVLLLHVEEGVASQVYGQEARTAEEAEGAAYLARIVDRLAADGIEASAFVRYSSHPRAEIVRLARERNADLVIMGSHGHQGLKDLIFGSTINAVRHELGIPVLAVPRVDGA
jgi:manganese transport protein